MKELERRVYIGHAITTDLGREGGGKKEKRKQKLAMV